ncbi:MAG: YggW family oxidoreductase [Thiothrix nivea]|nr:MAG: YggW family oxidoreductase [Thiothrix nivea]
MSAIPLSLYIHIPWCIRKCPYCDFNSHNAPTALPESQYIQALLDDLASELPYIRGRRLESIFIGGGTPSLFSAEGIERLINGIHALIPFRPDIEITLEANPGTFEQARFRGFRVAGVNRLSIGIQSFNQQHLSALGRVHSSAEALQAADIVTQAGFDNFNLDLMFGLPQQTLTEALQDLQQAIDLNPTHLSWYQLTLEPNTAFYKYPPTLPEDDLIADIQITGQQLLSSSRYNQYEVSAYACNRQTCQHNLNYWEFGDYIGIGAGAHGKVTHPDQSVTRYQKYRQPAHYLQQVAAGQGRSNEQSLSANDLKFEFMLNALRLRHGFTTTLFEQRTGLQTTSITQELQLASQRGLLHTRDLHICPTERGWLYLNEVIQLFLDHNPN